LWLSGNSSERLARPSRIKQQECIKGERFSIWWNATWWKCEQKKSPRGLRDWASRFPILGAQRQQPLEWSDFAFTVIHFKCQCRVRPFQTTLAAPICVTARRAGSMSQQHTLRTAAGYTSPRRQAASLLPRFFCVFFWLFPRWPFPDRVLRHRSLPGRGRRRRSLPAGVLRHRPLLHRYCWWSRRHVENNSAVVVEEVLAAHEASTAPFAGVRHGR